MFRSKRKSGMSRRAVIARKTASGRMTQGTFLATDRMEKALRKQRNQNPARWGKHFLLKVATEQAKDWQARVESGLEL